MNKFRIEIAGRVIYFESQKEWSFDEIASMWLIKKFATEKFLNEYAPHGTMLLDINNNPFKEDYEPIHDKSVNDKEKRLVVLIANALKVEESPVLEKILKIIPKSGFGKNSHIFCTPSMIRMIHQSHDDYKATINWVLGGLEFEYSEQLSHFFNTKRNFRMIAKIEKIRIDNQDFKLVTIVSDDKKMIKFAKSKYGEKADIIIDCSSSGSDIHIYTNNKSLEINMDKIFSNISKIIRIKK